MNKYIEADKLIAEIRQYYESSKDKARYAGQTGTSSDCAKWDEAVSIYESVLHIITSLQQEQEQPEVELEKAARNVYESWMGGTMDDVRRDMVELGKVLNARKG